MSAHTVRFDTKRYFGAKKHATLEDAFNYALANEPRSFGMVVRDASGRRYSIREIIDLRKGGAS